MAMEVAAITAGPVKNRTAIANVATLLPQEMSFGCRAMKRPKSQCSAVRKKNLGSCKEQTVSLSEQISNRQCLVPKLNIAIPSPASDNIDIDPFIIEGIWMFHLKFSENKMC
jgi:hypothetical protein